MRPTRLVVALALCLVLARSGEADDRPLADLPLRICLDASQSGGAREAGLSIERGIRAALDLLGHRLGGRAVELIVRDHRASTPRSRKHLREFQQDPRAIVAFGGMHSPPILALRDEINANGMPMLIPWAAAGPITRGDPHRNFIFRLSVDDTKAGFVIARAALAEEGLRRPFLVLEDTGWGESNLRTMREAIAAGPGELAGVARFGWGMSQLTASELLEDAHAAEADVIFFVGNFEEGLEFARAMLALPPDRRLPIRSHWGITGGDFYERVGAEGMRRLDLRVIQTRFSWSEVLTAREQSDERTRLARSALERAATLEPEVAHAPTRMRAALGFAHAFDLTLILAKAAEGIDWSGDIRRDRERLRDALENVEGPLVGLVKTYDRPFTAPTRDRPDAHEALGLADLRMVPYAASDRRERQPSPAARKD